jgi:hypothetical protein
MDEVRNPSNYVKCSSFIIIIIIIIGKPTLLNSIGFLAGFCQIEMSFHFFGFLLTQHNHQP